MFSLKILFFDCFVKWKTIQLRWTSSNYKLLEIWSIEMAMIIKDFALDSHLVIRILDHFSNLAISKKDKCQIRSETFIHMLCYRLIFQLILYHFRRSWNRWKSMDRLIIIAQSIGGNFFEIFNKCRTYVWLDVSMGNFLNKNPSS